MHTRIGKMVLGALRHVFLTFAFGRNASWAVLARGRFISIIDAYLKNIRTLRLYGLTVNRLLDDFLDLPQMDQTQEQPEDVTERIKGLEERNRDLVAKLMKAQRTNDPVTDISIGENFECILKAIQDWIQAVHRDMGDENIHYRRILEQEFNDGHFRDNVRRLLAPPDPVKNMREHEKMPRSDQQANVNWDIWIDWLKNRNTSHLLILSGTIWSYLERKIFARPYLTEMPKGLTESLDCIITHMQKGSNGSGRHS